MMWNDGSWGVGTWLAMSLMMLVFWGSLVALLVWLVRNNRHGVSRATGERADVSRRPAEVLADRFAGGEIDEDELRRRRELLHSPRARS